MAEDWLEDVKKYVANVDEAAVAGIVRHCGIALRNRDSSLVSFSDPAETDRVREGYLKKKLALTDPDAILDAAIASVGQRMKEDRTKNRVTVYYLLAEQFGKLGLFGAGAATAAADIDTDAVPTPGGIGSATAAGAAGLAAIGAAGTGATGPSGAGADFSGGGAGSGGTGSGGGSGGDGPRAFADVPEERTGGGSIFSKWWLWLLLVLALIALFLLLRSCQPQTGIVTTNTTVSDESMANYGDAMSGADNAMTDIGDNSMAVTGTPVAPPVGAGIVTETRSGLPAMTVYFDTGKADLAAGLPDKAADLKAYAAAHPDAKLAVSGYNDPTGNAAINAELSKRRAQAVAAALKAEGIPDGAVVLEKPSDTTIADTDKAAARRVEVTVK